MTKPVSAKPAPSQAMRELQGELRAGRKLGILKAFDGLTTRAQRQELLRVAIEAAGPDTVVWRGKTWREWFKIVYNEDFRS